MSRKLEQIEINFRDYKNQWSLDMDDFISNEDVEYLVEQAKKTEWLEENNKRVYWYATEFKFENARLEQENKRYKDVLDYVKENISGFQLCSLIEKGMESAIDEALKNKKKNPI